MKKHDKFERGSLVKSHGGIDSGFPDATNLTDASVPGPVVTTLAIDDRTIEAVRNGTSEAMNVHPVSVHVMTTPQGGNGRCHGTSTNGGAEAEWPALLGEDVTITLRPTVSTTYSIRCVNLAGGQSYLEQFTIQVMTVRVSPGLSFPQGQQVSLEYDAPSNVTSCTAGGAWNEPGPKPVPHWIEPPFSLGGGGIAGTFTLRLTCRVLAGEDPASYQFTIMVVVTPV